MITILTGRGISLESQTWLSVGPISADCYDTLFISLACPHENSRCGTSLDRRRGPLAYDDGYLSFFFFNCPSPESHYSNYDCACLNIRFPKTWFSTYFIRYKTLRGAVCIIAFTCIVQKHSLTRNQTKINSSISTSKLYIVCKSKKSSDNY